MLTLSSPKFLSLLSTIALLYRPYHGQTLGMTLTLILTLYLSFFYLCDSEQHF